MQVPEIPNDGCHQEVIAQPVVTTAAVGSSVCTGHEAAQSSPRAEGTLQSQGKTRFVNFKLLWMMELSSCLAHTEGIYQ